MQDSRRRVNCIRQMKKTLTVLSKRKEVIIIKAKMEREKDLYDDGYERSRRKKKRHQRELILAITWRKGGRRKRKIDSDPHAGIEKRKDTRASFLISQAAAGRTKERSACEATRSLSRKTRGGREKETCFSSAD